MDHFNSHDLPPKMRNLIVSPVYLLFLSSSSLSIAFKHSFLAVIYMSMYNILSSCIVLNTLQADHKHSRVFI